MKQIKRAVIERKIAHVEKELKELETLLAEGRDAPIERGNETFLVRNIGAEKDKLLLKLEKYRSQLPED